MILKVIIFFLSGILVFDWKLVSLLRVFFIIFLLKNRIKNNIKRIIMVFVSVGYILRKIILNIIMFIIIGNNINIFISFVLFYNRN